MQGLTQGKTPLRLQQYSLESKLVVLDGDFGENSNVFYNLIVHPKFCNINFHNVTHNLLSETLGNGCL
jgi:hypothetical protein